MTVLIYDFDPDMFGDDDDLDVVFAPLTRVLHAAGLDTRTDIRANVGSFMYMFGLVNENGHRLHMYKHVDTRRYLNVDDAGHTYEFVGESGEFASLYRPYPDLATAIAHLELDEFARNDP